ncbi:sulfonate transport system permease protein [Pseudochelatococcus lubricantis]|uniref:Sulfonate transport system permease protein n=1 Tax=Pseudochelatococcus lubricantis TaxID=1538102 RepID=A0ABX0V1S3_9HYPH|nr:ABC transporter permease [Pseudochelatococcus lubricantis]NIJ59162.1 sulfonate transport system permease protein [Pseudochelatococcus lubricantis]
MPLDSKALDTKDRAGILHPPPLPWNGREAERGDGGRRLFRPAGAGRLPDRLLPFALPGALLASWQAVTAAGFMPEQVLPPPSLVLRTFIAFLGDGEIANNLLVSLRRIACGLGIGVVTGFAFGLLLGVSRRAEAYLGPLFRAFAAVPALGWIPVLILILGIDEALKIVILSKACFVPMVIATLDAYRNIPARLREAADVMRLSPRTRLLKLTLPAMMPMLFGGLRLSAGQAFVSLIVVEMLAATEGIGYMMVWGRTLFQIDIVMVGMAIVGVTGFLLDALLRRIERGIGARMGERTGSHG